MDNCNRATLVSEEFSFFLLVSLMGMQIIGMSSNMEKAVQGHRSLGWKKFFIEYRKNNSDSAAKQAVSKYIRLVSNSLKSISK